MRDENPEIPNDRLHLDDIPPPRSSWDVIQKFALTFNGYEEIGEDECGVIANKRSPSTLSEMRGCLFYEQRRFRHFDQEPEKDSLIYI